MQWFYARLSREIPGEELMPNTASGIWVRLAELGNWRAKHVRRSVDEIQAQAS